MIRLAMFASRTSLLFSATLWLAWFLAGAMTQSNALARESASAPAFHPRRILVSPRPTTSPERLADFHQAQQTQVLRRFPRLGDLQLIELAPGDSVTGAVTRYQQSGLVEFAEPDYRVSAAATSPDDPKYVDGTLWGLNNYGQNSGKADADMDAPEAWDIRRSATNVIVAIVDSGVRYTHEDLAPNLWTHPVDGSHGWNAITATTNVWDDYGHGTHLAGIIGAAGNNSTGVVGVAWQSRIMACKFLDSAGDGFNADAITCIEFARSNGVSIINLSWGGTAYSEAVSNAIFSAQADGIVFTAAAGNQTRNNDATPYYPASLGLPNIVAVGASTRQDSLWSSSNYGSTSVDLFAPGAGIFSTTSAGNSSYGNMNGTSMATAYVSGALALLREQSPATPAGGLIARLLSSVDRRTAFANTCVSGGRLNLLKALDGVSVAASWAPPRPLELQMNGVPDHSYVLLASTNLSTWTSIATNKAGTDGVWHFTDLQSTNLPRRFYRGIPEP